MARSTPSFWKIWLVPLILVIVTLSGLLSALLGVQIAWKAASWIGLGIPIAVIGWFAWLRPLTPPR
jgi:hypothetical protein